MYLFITAYSFPQALLLEQVMSVDKYLRIFSCQMEAIVYKAPKEQNYFYSIMPCCSALETVEVVILTNKV